MDNQSIESKNFELKKLQVILQLYQNAKQQNVIAADRVISEANKTEAGLRNIQFTLATFLFTFTTPIFTKNVFNSNDVRILILLAWIFLLLSILSGFLHMSKVISFFLKQAELHTKKIEMYSQIGTIEDYQEINKKADALNSSAIPKSDRTPLIIQSLFLFIGFMLIFSAATIVLFAK